MTVNDAEGAPPGGTPPRRLHVEFTGSGGEYFRIWIVNLLLTIVTLGIYSAWAKVRRVQYFYRNTRVDGAVFDYHGRAGAILKGRLIVLVLAIAYNVSFRFSLVAGVIAALALVAVTPWLLTQSQRFRLHNSSYRGLRFRFLGSVRESYMIFAVPMLVILGIGGWFAEIGRQAELGVEPGGATIVVLGLGYLALMLFWPYLHFRFKQYQHANSALGNTRSVFTGKAGRFYLYYGIALLVLVGVAVLVFGGIGVFARNRGNMTFFAMGAGVLVFYLALLALGPYVGARVQNHVWNSTRLGPVGFESAVRARRLVWIVISNLVLIVITLGFFTPFAAVRAARYRLQSVTALSDDDLANFVGTSASEVAAVGEGAADLFDVDFAL